MTWPEIDHHISQITGEKFISNQHLPISGGCINQSYAISNSKITYFVKLNQLSQKSMFIAESLGLQQIYNTQTIRVPKPLCWGITKTSSYIVLEWLKMTHGNHQSWLDMGRKLAVMHKFSTNKGFGWDMDNTIGSTPQINNFHTSWSEFYLQNRLNYQLQLAKKQGGIFPQADKLLALIPQLFADYQIQPSLVHGDLWSGNVGFTIENEPVIFDPATYFADREVDIAMTELFAGFPLAFYQGYQEEFPLDQGYEYRKPLYNLYHILNHFNLFGGSYSSQANRMIEKILQTQL